MLLEEAHSFCKDINNVEKSSSESEEDTFFCFLHDKNINKTNSDIDITISDATKPLDVKVQCLTYLSDKSKDLNSLDKYPIIKKYI